MLPDFDFQFIAYLAIYRQMVDFQVVEPLGQRNAVGKLEGKSLDVWQLG